MPPLTQIKLPNYHEVSVPHCGNCHHVDRRGDGCHHPDHVASGKDSFIGMATSMSYPIVRVDHVCDRWQEKIGAVGG